MPEHDPIPLLEDLVAEGLERLPVEGPAVVDELARRCPELALDIRQALDLGHELGLVESGNQSVSQEHPDRLGEFQLLEVIGGGGMGVVYRAEQVGLGRPVALKVIRPELLHVAAARERFRREALAVARLQHPGIVPIHTVGEDGGVPYLAMELVDGRPLSTVLHDLASRDDRSARSSRDLFRPDGTESGSTSDANASSRSAGPATWVTACVALVRQIAEALEHAHTRGVAHRDVKPSNVMITGSGRALLLDFGLARETSMSRMTRTGSRPGSLPYMAPERLLAADDSVIDECLADVYSLGVTLYEMLTLELPFTARNPDLLVKRVLEGKAPRLRGVVPGADWDLENIVQTAMEPDMSRRYQTAGDFARDLGNLLAGRPVEARRSGIIRRSARWVRRRPAGAAAVFFAVLALGVVPGAWALRERALNRDLLQANHAVADQAQRANRSSEFLLRLLETTDGWTWANKGLTDREGTARQIHDLLADLDDGEASFDLHCLLARACDRLGLVNDADDIVTRALDMRRGLPVDGRYLEALMLASKTAFARGAPDRAVALAVEALDSSADDRELTDERRMKLLINALTHDPHSPQTDERLAELSDLIDDSSDELSRPLTAEIHQVRSVTSINRGDFASALADATRARDLKLSFGSHPAHVVPETAIIAYCQRRLGRVSEAIREARQGLADARGLLHPDHPVFRDLEAILGNALFAADHRDDAEPHLARAAELSGSCEKPSKASTEALYHLGILRDSQGRIEESIEAHQRAVQHALESSGKNSSDRGLNLALWGRGLRKDDRPTEALPHLLEAARILEDWMVDGDLRGFFLRQDLAPCLEAGGRHAEAAREWQAIARTAAMLERWKPYVNRWLLRAAQAFERAGDDESAKRLRDLVPDPQDERNDG